ncbi:hypothetical protein KKA00_09640, partial [bacterium]|nr:hypothetical protein [bacterium]
MASWGNQQEIAYPQDMESPSGRHLLATNNDANDFALKGVNSSGTAIHSDGKLQVDGDSDMNGDLDVSGTVTTDTIKASSGSLVEIANENHGSVNLGNGSYGDSIVKTLCPLHTNGFIDTISAVPLRVGQSLSNNASLIELGRSGILTKVLGTFQVDYTSTFYGAATFNDPATFNDAATFGGGTTTLNAAVDINNTVDHDCNVDGVGLDVKNSSTGQSAVGIKSEARVALEARGKSAFTDN